MALPRRNRLSLRTSKDLFLDTKKVYSSHFTVIRSNSYDPKSTSPAFAIVVSKKTARRSHDRHQIRRLTSAAIFRLLNQFPVGYYLVFPKGSVQNTSFADIVTDLNQITEKHFT